MCLSVESISKSRAKSFKVTVLKYFPLLLWVVLHLTCCRSANFATMVVNHAGIYILFSFLSFFLFQKKKSLFGCVCRPGTPLSDESGEAELEAGHEVVD